MGVISAHLQLARAIGGVAVVCTVLAGCTSGGGAGSSGSPGSPTSAGGTAGGTASASSPTSPSSPTGSPSASSSKTKSGQTAPLSGTINDKIEPVTVPTKPAVRLTGRVDVDRSVRVSLKQIRSQQVSAMGPGEIAGSALVVTVHVVNRSTHAIDVSSAVVTLTDSDGQVGIPTTASPAAPFHGRVAPGKSADGIYVFTVSRSKRNPINVFVSYSAGTPVARFVGDAA